MSLLSDIAIAIKTKLGGASINNTIPRYDGIACSLKSSGVTISDTDVVTAGGGFVGNLTGTASNATLAVSATKLATARTINGVVFDGSANITIPSIPTGGIIMWSGSIATIPAGWLLCDGANGTPDLRNRFVIGSSVDVSGVSNTAVTGANTKSGGSKDAIVVAHSHTGSTNSTGAHTHTLSNVSVGAVTVSSSSSSSGSAGKANYDAVTSSSSGAHTHSLTINSTGSSGTDANLPPYYALAFIMKI